MLVNLQVIFTYIFFKFEIINFVLVWLIQSNVPLWTGALELYTFVKLFFVLNFFIGKELVVFELLLNLSYMDGKMIPSKFLNYQQSQQNHKKCPYYNLITFMKIIISLCPQGLRSTWTESSISHLLINPRTIVGYFSINSIMFRLQNNSNYWHTKMNLYSLWCSMCTCRSYLTPCKISGL